MPAGNILAYKPLGPLGIIQPQGANVCLGARDPEGRLGGRPAAFLAATS